MMISVICIKSTMIGESIDCEVSAKLPKDFGINLTPSPMIPCLNYR